MSNEQLVDIYGEEEVLDTSKKIETKEDAVRYAYGLSATLEEIKDINELAEREIAKWQEKIDKVKEWQEGQAKPLEEKAEYFKMLLSNWHYEQFAQADEKGQKKLKTIKLPYDVTLASREQAVKYEVSNQKEYEEYAKTQNFLKPPKAPEVDWAGMKKNLDVLGNGKVINKETGEVLDFLVAVPQERKFEVK